MGRDAPGWEKFLLNPITQEGDALFQLLLRIDFVYPCPQISWKPQGMSLFKEEGEAKAL